MTRQLEVDEEAAEEAEAQVRYYSERAGTRVSLRFVSEIEAIYVGLVEGRFVGVNHPRVGFRIPVKRVSVIDFLLRWCSSWKRTLSTCSRSRP